MARTRRIAFMLALIAFLGIPVGSLPVFADTAPASGVPETVTADPLSTWQTDGIVWSLAQAGGTVFAGGNFTSVRPPGASVGDPAQLSRVGIAAFNVATGVPTSFQHTVTGTTFTASSNPSPGECRTVGTNTYLCDEVLRVKASPSGDEVYASGDFTAIDGQPRYRLAGFSVSSGALDPIMRPVIDGRVRAIAVTDSTVYIGGAFETVNGEPRQHLAALDRTTGQLLPWDPTTDSQVWALAVSGDGSRVVVGGAFDHLNGVAINGVASVDGTTGASTPWSSHPIPARTASTWSMVVDLVVDGDTVYGGANGNGGGVFDGRFAANIATGDLKWIDTCLGATSGITVLRDVLYSTEHAHDCSSMGGWSQTNPTTYQRMLAETTTDSGHSTLLHWFPSVNIGPANSYYQQGGWALTNDDNYLWVGGEFTTSNGVAQQGLTRYTFKSVSPDVNPPETPFAAPTVLPVSDTTLRVRWKATWDRDSRALTYEILRDGANTPIATIPANSNFWTLPGLSFVDTGLAPSSSHFYRVRVKDPFGNARSSPNSASVTATGSPLGTYGTAVLADGASPYWRLNEASGATAFDIGGVNDGTYGTGVTRSQAGALAGSTDTAARTNGTATGTIGAATQVSNPTNYSVELWFKSTGTATGKLIGFGNAVSGNSSQYDRHVYLNNTGRLVFGAWTGSATIVTSPAAYNNGAWHYVVATQGPAGMALYADGVLVGSNANTIAENYSGYWRVGGDNLNGWTNVPSNSYFNGTVDEAAVYPSVLSATQVAAHWAAGH